MFSKKILTSLVALIAINAIRVEGQNVGDFIPPFMDIVGGFVPRSQRFREPAQPQGYLVTQPNAPGFNQKGSENITEAVASLRNRRHPGQDPIDGSKLRSETGFNGFRPAGLSFGQNEPKTAVNVERPDQTGSSGSGRPGRPERFGRPGNGRKVVSQPNEDGQDGQNPNPDKELDIVENNYPEDLEDQAETFPQTTD